MIEAQIAPRDIDQLTPGQDARIRLTPFNRNTTPEFRGSVIRVSPDLEVNEAGEAYYRATVALSANQLISRDYITLLPGMPAEVFITTQERSVMSYFFKPLADHTQRAFRSE